MYTHSHVVKDSVAFFRRHVELHDYIILRKDDMLIQMFHNSKLEL